MIRVRMTHPELPGAEIRVRPQSVPVHERAGWQQDAGQPPAQDSGAERAPGNETED